LEVGERLSALQAHRYLWDSRVFPVGWLAGVVDEWKEGRERRREVEMWRRDGRMEG
jgi:hypothetical protein